MVHIVRSKICGITRPEDGRLAADLGADALGLVFFSGSKRCVNIEQAQAIVRALPPFVSVVGLFVNEKADTINHILESVPIDVLQFHGNEEADFCRQFHRPYLKAVRVQNRQDIQAALTNYPDAKALLFDAFMAGEYGGTGHAFDWQMLPEKMTQAWILSGGLNVDNLAQALQQTGAQAVDVSSGVEREAGIKDAQKMAQFLSICRQFSVQAAQ